jgi:hypothetical protein
MTTMIWRKISGEAALLATVGALQLISACGSSPPAPPPPSPVPSFECQIWLTRACGSAPQAQEWFNDTNADSASSAGACMSRALDWLNDCGRIQLGDLVLAQYSDASGTPIALSEQRVDYHGVAAGPTRIDYRWKTDHWVPTQQTLPAPNIWAASTRLQLTSRALGDWLENYPTLASDAARKDWPKKGSVFVCQQGQFSSASSPDLVMPQDPWVTVNDATRFQPLNPPSVIDLPNKISVRGAVSWPNARFSATLENGVRHIQGNGLPVGLPTGSFPTAASDPAHYYDPNPNSIQPQLIDFKLPASPPQMALSPFCLAYYVGITLDGVALAVPLAHSGRDEIGATLQDSCQGMPQSGGTYKRQWASDCMPQSHQPAALVGYAMDGYGIYSGYDLDGNELVSADLDECHGITSPVNVDGNVATVYHYVMTRDFPYSVSCFKGQPLRNAFPDAQGQHDQLDWALKAYRDGCGQVLAPSDPEVDAWNVQIAAGTADYFSILSSIRSDLIGGTGRCSCADVIQTAFADALGRPPTPAETGEWTASCTAGHALYQEIVDALR